MQKKIYLGSNLKMYKTIAETSEYLKKLVRKTENISRKEMELFIIPSYMALDQAVKSVSEGSIKLGAQNMSWEVEGQYTGEISPKMLKEIGLDLVMIGHSERRHIFGETDIEINKKVLRAIEQEFTALLCIGETAEQKELGIGTEALKMQLKIGLKNILPNQLKKLWIAYEPVWSIGVNGIPAPASYAAEVHKMLKETLTEIFGESAGEIPVLYGGSVNSSNAEELIKQPFVDGLFIGRSAWNADDFHQLIQKVLACRRE